MVAVQSMSHCVIVALLMSGVGVLYASEFLSEHCILDALRQGCWGVGICGKAFAITDTVES